MGRPAKFTYDELAKAADEIAATGKRPTMRLLREKLGGGSDTSINDGLRRWVGLHPETTTRPAPELPHALLRAIAGEFDRVAAEARAEAEGKRMAAEDETIIMTEAAKKLEDERDALLDQVDVLKTERDQSLTLAKEREQDNQRLNELLTREQIGAESARVQVAKLELKIEGEAVRIQEQAQEIARLRDELAVEVAARRVAERDLVEARARLDAERDTKAGALAREQSALEREREAIVKVDAVRAEAREVTDRLVAEANVAADKRVAEIKAVTEQEVKAIKAVASRDAERVLVLEKASHESSAKAASAEARCQALADQVTDLKARLDRSEASLEKAREVYMALAGKAPPSKSSQEASQEEELLKPPSPPPIRKRSGAQLADRQT